MAILRNNKLGKIALFMALVIFMLSFVNIVYINFINTKKIAERKDKQLFDDLLNIEVLFVGDSHFEQGLNPDIINNSFNWSVGGESYKYTYFRLKYLFQKENNIKKILLPIDPNSFLKELNNCGDINYWSKYISVDELIMCKDTSKLNIYLKKHLPMIGGGEKFIDILINENITELKKGFYNDNKYPELNEINESAKGRSSFVLKNNKIDEMLLEYFVKTLELARSNNIDVYLVKSPLYSEYLKEITSNVDLNYYYEEIFDNIPNNITFQLIDFQNSLQGIEYFSDADHVNMKGSNLFSEYVSKIIKF